MKHTIKFTFSMDDHQGTDLSDYTLRLSRLGCFPYPCVFIHDFIRPQFIRFSLRMFSFHLFSKREFPAKGAEGNFPPTSIAVPLQKKIGAEKQEFSHLELFLFLFFFFRKIHENTTSKITIILNIAQISCVGSR